MWSALTPTRVFEKVDCDIFNKEIVAANQPAIIKGLVADWPLVALANQSPAKLCEHFEQAAQQELIETWWGSPEMKGRFFYNDDIKTHNFEKKRITISELLNCLLATVGVQAAPHIFAGCVDIAKYMPGVLEHISAPILSHVDYKIANLWIGNRTRTAAHWDMPQNLACVVSGRRRFITFPITQLKNLYFGPINNTLAGQATSLVDFYNPDFERFPLFKEALQYAEVAELEAGDALYMPSMRIHHVESLDNFGAMINFWWRAKDDFLPTPSFTLCHALLTLRELPIAERKAWREVFDHYIFDYEVNDIAHIPESARGILGKLTPEVQQQISAMVLKSLSVQ